MEIGVTPPSGTPATGVQLTTTVISPDGHQSPLTPSLAGEGKWLASFAATDQPGDYQVEVTATLDGQSLGSAKARFLVPRQDLELDRPGADPALLAQLAKLTEQVGGMSYAPEELPALIRQLADAPPEIRTEVTERKTFWDTWPFLLLFVSVVGTEWYLRKRWGLV